MALAKRTAKQAANAVGLELRRRQPHPLAFLAFHDIRTVLDVGAHDGEFAATIRKVLPEATVHSFEPLPDIFQRLRSRNRGDRRFHAWNLAIGDQTGSFTMHVKNFPATSSLLPAGSLGKHFPHLTTINTQPVTVTTLDTWSQEVALHDGLLLKADVQGFEGHVLRGASRLLERSPVLLLEVSFEPLYAGQPLFEEIASWLAERGYRLQGMVEPIADPRTGRQLQSNAVFRRDGTAALLKAG
jgi:FkbM family methyltransferase